MTSVPDNAAEAPALAILIEKEPDACAETDTIGIPFVPHVPE